MPHTNVISAAVAGSSRRRPRLSSTGSFHAGDIIPSLSPYDMGDPQRRRSSGLRRQSSVKYTTFPTQPPKTPSEDPDGGPRSPGASDSGSDDRRAEPTPLPTKQLALLALLSLSEQTALNSISPYLPEMVRSFDGVPAGSAGLYVGILASAFALAQLATNLLWGYLSDVVGRKPVLLLGTALLAACFAVFGFCESYWQVLAVHVAMGLLNGNAAVVPTCLGEVTDRTNQSRAFTWLPVMYSVGGITGPALGGLLAGRAAAAARPYLAPNLASAALLLASVLVLAVWFDETLDDAEKREPGPWPAWLERLCGRGRRGRGRLGSWSSRWPTRRGEGRRDDPEDGEDRALLGDGAADAPAASVFRRLLNHRTVVVLLTYLVFQLSNVGFNSLYPIFASSPPDTGRGLAPGSIGLLLSSSGVATIVFQVFAFQPLKSRLGNVGAYRASLLGLAVSTALMPWVGHADDPPPWGLGDGRWWLYAEMAAVLAVKNICAVGGLSSVLLLVRPLTPPRRGRPLTAQITNSAPGHETLGTLNGIAQTLSAAGRSVGPFLSGALFTLSAGLEPKGELLAWGVFGGVSLAGWLGSLTVRGDGLESADWVGDESDEEG